MVLGYVVIGSQRFEETYRLRLQALSPKAPDDEGRSFRNVAIRLPRDAASYPWRTHSVIHSFIHSFHLVVCLTIDPKPLPKRALHTVRSRASSFEWEYPLLSLRSSSSFLRLLPCPPVTSIPSCIFPSITRCRRQFLREMWPIQFAFRLRISCRIFLCSLILSNTSSFLTWSIQRKNSWCI